MSLRALRWLLPSLVLPSVVAPALAAGPKLPRTSIPPGAPAEVRKQIEGLYSRSAVERVEATWALADLGPKAEAAIPFLLSMAGDGELIVVANLRAVPGRHSRVYSSPEWEAAEALARIGPRSVEPLLSMLKDALASPRTSEPEIILAGRALGMLGEKRAVEPLVTALDDRSKGVRAAVAEALAAIKDAKGMEALFDSLAGGKAKKQAHEALEEMAGVKLPPDPAAWRSWWAENRRKPVAVPRGAKPTLPRTMPAEIQRLVGRLYAPEPLERGKACEALGRLGGKAAPAVPFLVETLRDDGALDIVWKKSDIWKTDMHQPTTVGEEAARALGQIGSAAVPPLLEALESADPFVRSNAAKALGDTRDKRGVDALVLLLKDKDVSVSSSAASSLGRIKDPRAVEPLLDVVRNGPYHHGAADALREIGDRSAVDPLLAILSTGSGDAKAAAAHALGKFREPRAVEALLALVRDGPARREAVLALSGIHADAKVVDALIALLGAGSGKTRAAAALGLGFCANEKAVDPLLAALTDKDEDVQAEAAVALGRLGDPRAVAPLRAQAQTAKKKKARDAAHAAVRALEPVPAR
jgi:HEAT repeat protein